MPAIRIWLTTPLTAPRQRLIHTFPRSAAYEMSAAQDYHPNAWSNSSSGIGSASTPALCNDRSCPASAVRLSVCHPVGWISERNSVAQSLAHVAVHFAKRTPSTHSYLREIASCGPHPGTRFLARVNVAVELTSEVCRQMEQAIASMHMPWNSTADD